MERIGAVDARTHVNPESQVITRSRNSPPEDFMKLLIESIQQGTFDTTKKYSLSNQNFHLPPGERLTLPVVIELLNNITVTSGTLHYFDGSATAMGTTAIAYAEGWQATSFSGAGATAIASNHATANAVEPYAKVIAVNGGKGYACAGFTKATAIGPTSAVYAEADFTLLTAIGGGHSMGQKYCVGLSVYDKGSTGSAQGNFSTILAGNGGQVLVAGNFVKGSACGSGTTVFVTGKSCLIESEDGATVAVSGKDFDTTDVNNATVNAADPGEKVFEHSHAIAEERWKTNVLKKVNKKLNLTSNPVLHDLHLPKVFNGGRLRLDGTDLKIEFRSNNMH